MSYINTWRDPDAVDLLEGLGRVLIASSLDTPKDQEQAVEDKLKELVHDTPATNELLVESLQDLIPFENTVDRSIGKTERRATPEGNAFMDALKGRDKEVIFKLVMAAYDAAIASRVEDAKGLIEKWQEAA